MTTIATLPPDTDCSLKDDSEFNAAADQSPLLDHLAIGDESAYEQLVRSYGGRMLAVTRRLIHCEHEAQDAVQEAFLSSFRGLRSFADNSSLATWLYRITVNVCLMKLRSQARRGTVSMGRLLLTFDDDGQHARPVLRADQPPEILARKELRAAVRNCIDRLPKSHRAVLILRDMEELDTAQTAELLGISTDAVKARL